MSDCLVTQREAVRYITNTSSGARGAALCEQLLRLGYYVVYLTSVRAMKPFVRHLLPTHPMPHMLDFISLCTVQHQQKEEGQEEEVEEEEQQPQPIVEEPSSDTDASECEEGVSSPSPPPSSRHLACQTFSAVYEAEEEPDAQVVTSVGSVLKSSDQPTDENAPAEAEPASASPSADAGEVAAAEAAATAAAAEDSAGGELPWRVVLRGPFDTEKGDEEEAADSSGWEFDVREAAAALELYRHCKSRLLCITYRTLVDYAFIVRAVAAGAAPLRERLMFCSAAAVADFYLPYAVMSPHKLKTQQQQQQLAQRPAAAAAEGADTAGPRDMHRGSSRWGSFAAATQPKRWFTGEAEVADTAGTAPGETREGPQQQQLQHQHSSHHHLTLRLWVAPKVLSVVRSVAPECFVVAFKLETDAAHLQECAALYLEPGDSSSSSSSSSSGHGMADCVVGNVLSSRRQTAILFTKGGQRQISFKGKRSHKYFGVLIHARTHYIYIYMYIPVYAYTQQKQQQQTAQTNGQTTARKRTQLNAPRSNMHTAAETATAADTAATTGTAVAVPVVMTNVVVWLVEQALLQ